MNEVIIGAQLPTLNEYTRSNRSHWSKGAKFKQNIEDLIGWYIVKAIRVNLLHPVVKPCELYIEWHERTKKRDVDNIQSAQKFILDALQKHNIIKNDSRRYVKQIHHNVVDDKIDYVVVRIEEVE